MRSLSLISKVHDHPPLDAARLGPLVTTTSGPFWCHAPAGQPFDLDALARRDDDDRWSASDLPTAYLAADPLTAVAEFVRHAPANGTPLTRDIVQLELRPTAVLDLCRPDVRDVIGTRAEARACLDRSIARGLSRELRRLEIAEGLIVPSMAFLDRPDRRNLVLFLERVRGGIAGALSGPEVVGSVRLDR